MAGRDEGFGPRRHHRNQSDVRQALDGKDGFKLKHSEHHDHRHHTTDGQPQGPTTCWLGAPAADTGSAQQEMGGNRSKQCHQHQRNDVEACVDTVVAEHRCVIRLKQQPVGYHCIDAADHNPPEDLVPRRWKIVKPCEFGHHPSPSERHADEGAETRELEQHEF